MLVRAPEGVVCNEEAKVESASWPLSPSNLEPEREPDPCLLRSECRDCVSMDCSLHTYDSEKRLVYARSGTAADVVVFVGGLGDGLLAVPYIKPLADRLQQEGWSLVQALTSSSYDRWKTGSIQRDAAEISALVDYLRSDRYFNGLGEGKKYRQQGRMRVVLLGHSTGCQDIVEYCRQPEDEERGIIDGAILQAPVRQVRSCPTD